tara:strand:- start:1402 stop:1830 length:429 start_codon:yes stop_codon:yes gene_type:complete
MNPYYMLNKLKETEPEPQEHLLFSQLLCSSQDTLKILDSLLSSLHVIVSAKETFSSSVITYHFEKLVRSDPKKLKSILKYNKIDEEKAEILLTKNKIPFNILLDAVNKRCYTQGGLSSLQAYLASQINNQNGNWSRTINQLR